MADRTLTVRILGDSRSLTREFARSSGAARRFNRDIDRTFRGVVAGSGAFRSLGRAVAFASTSFLGAAGLGAAVAGAFGELAESRRVTAQTNAALRSTGAVAGVTARHVEELGNALLRKTGIDDEAIRSAENLLLTFTNVRNSVGAGNDVFDQATKAILDMSVAMGGDLEGATIRVGKALQDPIRGATALRRVGVQLTESQEKQIKAFVRTGRTMDAQRVILRELAREFGGSAAAAGNVQPWNLLRETIRNLSAEMVNNLLPQIQDVVGRLQRWFDDTRNQERVQRDFAEVVKVAGQVLRTLVSAFKTLQAILQPVVSAIGGTKNAIKLLLALFVASKVLNFATAIRNIGTSADVAAGSLKGLNTKLQTLKAIGPIVVTVAIVYSATKGLEKLTELAGSPVKLFGDPRFNTKNSTIPRRGADGIWRAADGSPVEDQGFWETRYRQGKVTRDGRRTRGGVIPGAPGSTNDRLPSNRRPSAGVDVRERFVPRGTRTGLSATQRNTFFDNALTRSLDRVQDLGLNDQLRRLREVSSLITARIAATKDITRKLTLEDRLVDVRRQIKSVQEQIADNLIASSERARQKIEDARAKMQETLEAIRVARNARQFRALGLTATGDEPVPGVKALRRQLSRVGDVVKGTFLDTGKTRSLLSNIRRVLSGGLGAVGRDVRAKVAEMLTNLDRQLREHEVGPGSKFRAIDTDKFLEGLTLPADQRRALRARLAQVGQNGTVPRSGPSAFGIGLAGGGGMIVTGPITVVASNPDAFERELVKKARRRATQTTGPHAGNGMGFVR